MIKLFQPAACQIKFSEKQAALLRDNATMHVKVFKQYSDMRRTITSS